jgi:hypothetical protein
LAGTRCYFSLLPRLSPLDIPFSSAFNVKRFDERGQGMENPQRVGTDELERQVICNISEYGWHCVNVVEDDGHPPWSFTIGLYETWNHPELIIIGRSRATSHEILKTLANDIELNDPPNLTNPDGHLLLGMRCLFVEVLPRYYSDYVGFAKWFYRKRHFPLHQIVWPNNDGQYPCDENASKAFKEWQPVLGDPSA